MRKVFPCVLILITSYHWSSAQSQDIYSRYNIYRNPLRVFLNHFSWTVSSGYGVTNYAHDLDGFELYQDATGQYIRVKQDEPGTVFQGYAGWFNDPYPGDPKNLDNIYEIPYEPLPDPVNNPALNGALPPFNGDSITFSSLSATIPVLASVHFDLNKFRFGLGFQFERHFINQLNSSYKPQLIRPYDPGFKKTSYTKYFGMIGYRFYEWWDYAFVLEVQMGRSTPGKEINTSALGIGQNFFTNVGINVEHNLSEYLRVVIRPSYDLKSYVINLPEVNSGSIRHSNRAFLVQVGISINIPEIPRSPMKSDHVQLKHVITDPVTGRLMEVRGQPLWKKQNPKVGENHRRLWRYKWKNRRKLDPY